MDRGRVGTLAIGNKTIRDQMIAHQQEVHMARIQKIQNRKPGTGTLDNTAPVIIKAALVNPRKIAKKKEFNEMTEKENRVLLKRISNTLTAPPKITDAEYKAMKALIGNMKGGKAQYEAAVLARHHKIYLDHLKKMGPYYDPTEWELDYRRQKVQQMFMREVPYERPKDFVVKPLPDMKTLGTIHDKNDFKPHFTQRPDYPGRRAPMDAGKSVTKVGGAGQVNRVRSMRSSKDQDSEGKQNDNYGDEYFETGEERVELACTHRFIKVQVLTSTGDKGEEENRWGEITCYLLEENIFLICARLQDDAEVKGSEEKDTDRAPVAYEAEAEIDINAIAELRGLDGNVLLEAYRMGEVAQIQALARYISESVDIKVEENIARIILNLAEAEEGDEHQSNEGCNNAFFMTEGLSLYDGEEGLTEENAQIRDMYDGDLQLDADSLGSADIDAYSCSFEGVFCRVKVVGGPKIKHREGFPKAVEKTDSVLLSCSVKCEVDVISVEATVTKESTMLYKKNAAVPKGTTFLIKSKLPSIMQADGELMKEYFCVLVENLQIDTHHMTGKNSIVLLQQ